MAFFDDTALSDNDVIETLRKHSGGLGEFLTEQEKQNILNRHGNHPENSRPIDREKFLAAADEAFRIMPLAFNKL